MKLSKELYDKICVWMADKEDPSLAMEEMVTLEERQHYMLDQAFDIIYAVYSAHVTEMVLEEENENTD